MAIEENFGFDITHDEAEKITKIDEAIAIFYKYMSAKVNTKIEKINEKPTGI